MVGAALHVVIGECGITVLEHETTFLLTSLVAPIYIHLAAVRREETSHALCCEAHVEHVVVAQGISHGEGLAWGSLGSQGDRLIGYVGWSEVEVAGDDVRLLRLKHELQALVCAVEERHVILVGGAILHLQVVPHITLDDCLLDSTTLGVEGQLNLLVLQNHFLCLTLQSRIEKGCRVGLNLSLCIGLALISGSLASFLHLGVLSLGDGILYECRSLLFRRRLVVPTETNQYHGNQ